MLALTRKIVKAQSLNIEQGLKIHAKTFSFAVLCNNKYRMLDLGGICQNLSSI